MNLEDLAPAERERHRRKRVLAEAVSAAVVSHLVLAVLAGTITIVVFITKPPVTFEAKQPPSIPARKLEHSIRVKQMQEQTRKPQILERLAAQSPSAVALPELPKMDVPNQKSLRDQPVLSARAGGALGSLGGSGGGAGRGLTGGSGYSDTQFFGENVRTRAIAICMDISPSMVAKGVVEDTLRESIRMLESLSPVTQFNLIVFVDGAESFAPQMVFATEENKKKALEWLGKPFDARRQGNRRGYSGSTPSEAIRMAVELGVDTLFVLSDDPPYLKQGDAETGVELTEHREDIEDYVRAIESTRGQPVKINAIVYKPKDNERGREGIDFYRKISRLTGGRFRHVKE